MSERDSQVERALALLGSIAESLAKLADAANPPEPPDWVFPIEQYTLFDWAAHGVTVLATDSEGPTLVQYGGQNYKRRAPDNAYDPAVWYSHCIGKDEDGRNQYVRLVTFRKFKEDDVQPLGRKAERAVKAAPVAARTASRPVAAPMTAGPSVRPEAGAEAAGGLPVTPGEQPEAERMFAELESADARIRAAGEAVQHKLQRMAVGFNGQGQTPASDDLRSRAFNHLRTLCGNSEERRHLVLRFVFGKASLTEITTGEAQALRDWINAQRQGDNYVPGDVAANDLQAILAACELRPADDNNRQEGQGNGAQ